MLEASADAAAGVAAEAAAADAEVGLRGGAGCLADGGLSWKDCVTAAALLATAF